MTPVTWARQQCSATTASRITISFETGIARREPARQQTALAGALQYRRFVCQDATKAGMDPEAARAEAIKNSMFPGGALMYLTGTDRIHRLRRQMTARWGNGFSLRRFHDTFLSHGSIPVTLIARLMAAD